MPTRDYNGEGPWAAGAIIERYGRYAREHRLCSMTDLQPRTHAKGEDRWVYPVMERVIAGIEAGDPACAEIGVDFISEDASFPFGMVLKTKTARALRRAALTQRQQDRIRARVFDMLLREYLPREYREYAKLLRRIGLGNCTGVLGKANGANPHVARYLKYFREAASNAL